MISLVNGDIPVYKSNILDIPHAFTGRQGGVSRKNEFKSLNLGLRTEDDDENITENYRRIKALLGIERLVLAKQEHTAAVMAVDENDADKTFDFGVDGLVTNCKNLALGVFTADCVPVLLYDPVKAVIGAVHSGWRGTVQKICKNAVLLMAEKYGCIPENIRAVIGPSIGKCCFEIGDDTAEEIKSAFPYVYHKYVVPKNGKFLADNSGLVEYTLKEYGVTMVDKSCECTYCNNDMFFSHRKGDRGRQCGFIMT